MARISLALAVALGLVVSVVPAGPAPAQEDPDGSINEFVANHDGTDDCEFVEIFGPAEADLSGLTVVQVEGDDNAPGTVDTVLTVGTTGAGGYWVSSFLNGEFENGTITLLLVQGFVGSDGQDLDTDDDGVFDETPWTSIVDSVAVFDGGAGDKTYSETVLTTATPPAGSFPPGGASRIPDGTDTNAAADWVRNDFDSPCFSGSPADGEAVNTPGTTNRVFEAPPPPPPAESDLKVNEIDYDQAGTDTAEFVEIYNSDDVVIDLTGLVLRFVNGSNGQEYRSFSFPDGTSLPAGGYFVFCANEAATPNCDLDVAPDTNLIQNGAPDAVALIDTADNAVIDAVSYEGAVPGYAEGTAGAPADGNDAFVGISRVPNGADTNDNAFDFKLVCVTPGEANSDATTNCPNPTPPVPMEIYDVQGSETSSPVVGTNVTIDGIVVGDFQGDALGDNQLRGFHLQEATGDGDEGTSDGIFVFDSDAPDVSLGDYVVVTGTVAEFDGLTEITNVTDVSTPDTAPPDEMGPIAPTLVTLPVSDEDEWEQYEGMLITFGEAELYISEFFNFDRTNEVVLTTDRQYQGTQIAQPGDAANAVAAANALAQVTIDDGRMTQNPDPALHPNGDEFDLTNTFRGGDILSDVTGVVHESKPYFSDFVSIEYRVHQTAPATYEEENERPTSPEDVGGDLKVATFNVLNFFTHLDDGDNDICGPTGDLECRGADNEEELQRQLDKLVAGIIALDSDIVGIQEIENDIHDDEDVYPNRAHDAVLTLVEALNDEEGAEVWAWVGPANHYNDYPVRNDIIYRTDSVVPVGSPVAMEHEAFDAKRGDDIEPVGRPPLAQTFRPLVDRGSRQPFTVVVNHFKSKGSPCDGFIPPGFDVDDPDEGDGQANCNLTRVAQANALLDFIAELDDDSSGILAIGDFNSYALEDPIETLENGGLTNLVGSTHGLTEYSYLFDGQLGTLDYIMSSRSMLNRVTGVTVFHINADEPDIIDYDTSFKEPAQADLYQPNMYRASDHDPIVVGLAFGGPSRGGPPPSRGSR